MSRPHFLADEDLRREIVLAVRRLEPAVEIVTVQEVGLSGATDADVLNFANGNEWIVVSHDVNTMRAEANRRVAAGSGIAGLFLTAQSNATRAVADCLVLVWSASEGAEWRDRVEFIPFQ